jgi:hypothetical protein
VIFAIVSALPALWALVQWGCSSSLPGWCGVMCQNVPGRESLGDVRVSDYELVGHSAPQVWSAPPMARNAII